jgi:TATA-box binding protein (TBP) (component of TFIID and TFIIIB)
MYVLSKKNAKNNEKKSNVFKNCFTVVVLDESLKATTIKICKKGSFQLTGCKSMESAEFCVLSLLTNLWKLEPEINFVGLVPSKIDMTIKPVMTNVKFTIGYKISIVKALDFFEKRKDLHNFFSYKLRVNPAINIKQSLSATKDKNDLEIVPVRNVIIDRQNKSPLPEQKESPERMVLEITLAQYIDKLPFKEKQKHLKEKHTTLLLFRSGSVILSGIHENVMKSTFNTFQKMTTEYKELLQ